MDRQTERDTQTESRQRRRSLWGCVDSADHRTCPAARQIILIDRFSNAVERSVWSTASFLPLNWMDRSPPSKPDTCRYASLSLSICSFVSVPVCVAVLLPLLSVAWSDSSCVCGAFSSLSLSVLLRICLFICSFVCAFCLSVCYSASVSVSVLPTRCLGLQSTHTWKVGGREGW